MKKTKKLISLLLSVIMLLSITAGLNLSAYAAANPYTGGYNNCTYTAWEEVYNRHGIALSWCSDASQWLTQAKNAGYPVYTSGTCTPGSIAVWIQGGQHVAYVLSVSGSTMTVIEGGWGDGIKHTTYSIPATVGSNRNPTTQNQILAGYFTLNESKPTNVTFSSQSTKNIGNSSATVEFYTANPSFNVTKIGLRIKKTSESSWSKTYEEAIPSSIYQYNNPLHTTYEIGSGKEINYALSPGTSYTWQAYAVAGGKTYSGSNVTFTTTEPSTYTIRYDANGGSGAPAAQTKTNGVALTLSNTRPTRAGYAFLGWSISSTATIATYLPGDTYTANNNAKLYAVWSKIGTVSNVQVSNLSTTGATLTWNSVSGASGYELQYLLNGSWKTMCEITKNSKIFSQLTSNRLYVMRVRAFKTVNGSKTYSNTWSAPVAFTTYTTGSRMSFSNFTATGTTANLKAVTDAGAYEVQYLLNGKWVTMLETASSTINFNKLTANRYYIMRFRAFKTVNGTKVYSSNWSSPYGFMTSANANRISFSNINSKGATLNINKVQNAGGYALQYVSNGAWKNLGDTTANSKVFSSLASSTKYTFRVRAYSVVNGQKVYSGNWSGAYSFTTSIDATKLPAVQNFKAVNITKSGATLTFNKVSGANGYELQYLSNGVWKRFGDITTNSRTFNSLASSTSYTFRVRAYAVINGRKVYSNNFSYAVSFTTLAK